MLDLLNHRQNLTASAVRYEQRVLARIRAVMSRRAIPLRQLYEAANVHFYRLADERRHRLSLRGAVEAAHYLRVPLYLILAEPTPDMDVEVHDMMNATEPPGTEIVDGRTAQWRCMTAMHTARLRKKASFRRAWEISGASRWFWRRLETRLGHLPLRRLHAGCAAFDVDILRAIYDRSLGRAPLQEG